MTMKMKKYISLILTALLLCSLLAACGGAAEKNLADLVSAETPDLFL